MFRRLLTVAVLVAAAGAAPTGMQDPIDKIREADLLRRRVIRNGQRLSMQSGALVGRALRGALPRRRSRRAGRAAIEPEFEGLRSDPRFQRLVPAAARGG